MNPIRVLVPHRCSSRHARHSVSQRCYNTLRLNDHVTLEFIVAGRPCRATSQTFSSRKLDYFSSCQWRHHTERQGVPVGINVEVRVSADDLEYRVRKCQITETGNTPKRDIGAMQSWQNNTKKIYRDTFTEPPSHCVHPFVIQSFRRCEPPWPHIFCLPTFFERFPKLRVNDV